MKLLTKEIEKKLTKRFERRDRIDNELASTVGIADHDKAVVIFFNPAGNGTWYIFEGEKLYDGDWELFGVADLGEPEWGYVLLSQLEDIECPVIINGVQIGTIGIERDIYSKMPTRKQLREELRVV